MATKEKQDAGAKGGAPTRTRRQIDEDGTKERIAVKSGESIPRTR